MHSGLAAMQGRWQKLSDHLYCFQDTCNVYAATSGGDALLVDFGSGAVLDHLDAIGVRRVTDVLMTHHHRDQAQGLAHAVTAGARVWVPHAEQDLFARVDAHWQARELYANYNTRQDRFSLLQPMSIAGTLTDYSTRSYGAHTVTVVPTPGHTIGSVTLIAEIDDTRVAFCGDLMAGPGKLWSLAATQWSYSGAEGVAATLASVLDLRDRRPDLLLPSHGVSMKDPVAAISLLVPRLRELLDCRDENLRLSELRAQPYARLTPHLLRNRTSDAISYVLLSDSGKALFIDYGYDFQVGFAAGFDRAARRPWLYTLDTLKRDFGVRTIDVALPTHYHDDHVAGLNLLREVEGTRIWVSENFADVLAQPSGYNLPCLWFDPVYADRVLPLGQSFCWEEYELCLFAQPGHTSYAAAIYFEVDGKRVLAVGDQFKDEGTQGWNYIYQGGFQPDDYRHTAELYTRAAPDLILSGHWEPLWVEPEYFQLLRERGETLERLHRQLLPDEALGFGGDAEIACLSPYQATVSDGDSLLFRVTLHNPLATEEVVSVRPVVPPQWSVDREEIAVALKPKSSQVAGFRVATPRGLILSRARVAVDVTYGHRHLGQAAEALITVICGDDK